MGKKQKEPEEPQEPDYEMLIMDSVLKEVSSLGTLMLAGDLFKHMQSSANGKMLLQDVKLQTNFKPLSMSYGTPAQQQLLMQHGMELVGNTIFKYMGEEKFTDSLAKKVEGKKYSVEEAAEVVNLAFSEYMKEKIKDAKIQKNINESFKDFYSKLIDNNFLPNVDKKALKDQLQDMSQQDMEAFLAKASPILRKIFVGIGNGQDQYKKEMETYSEKVDEYLKQMEKFEKKEQASVSDQPEQRGIYLAEVETVTIPPSSIRAANNKPQSPVLG